MMNDDWWNFPAPSPSTGGECLRMKLRCVCMYDHVSYHWNSSLGLYSFSSSFFSFVLLKVVQVTYRKHPSFSRRGRSYRVVCRARSETRQKLSGPLQSVTPQPSTGSRSSCLSHVSCYWRTQPRQKWLHIWRTAPTPGSRGLVWPWADQQSTYGTSRRQDWSFLHQ